MSTQSHRAPRFSKPLALTLLALLCAIGGLYLYDNHRKQAAEEAALATGEADPIPVEVASVRSEVLPATVMTIGTVVADHQVLVAAEVDGRITKVHFTSGQTITAGTPLVQLNDGPLRSELERRRVALRLAQTHLERAKRLHGQTMSRAEFEQHVAAYDEARALVAQSEEDISQRLVRAPFTGELGLRRINLGQYVEAGTPIATLTDNRVLHIDFTVPERHRAALKTGLQVRVKGDGDSGKTMAGQISAIDPQVDKENHAIRVRATLRKEAQGTLWPGKFAHVALELSPGPAVTTIPTVALESSLSGERIYALRKTDGALRAQLVSVRTGAQSDSRTEVLGGTLNEGDLVVVAGQINLQDGALVAPRQPEALASGTDTVGSYIGKKE
ncbi:efflux RND transporter periplasmic adaptor subunit [Pseudomonas sp. JQ170]|uniref:efflux RND transporter periplasmic adaptor subunit n=1 Tax=unclassified Pseudomonas TaxID=196821 RepID=UPI00264EF7E4|nr:MULTISPECIES: efflux RND transporter periplasmic adaptor subunit [unclassified Pseudomonas]MDN7139906.1 efflux RND transporter periplasmic adaptor subunit [Pseudomonas sp. JQ170]WRO73644.1 efflux RND transporter periplasmic adaptor subunit [Pseudomonas sp. 170C]